ncbi:MAG: hypothetical protein Q7S38_01695, partial [bacterium]|nr:hypothetical protein [bacterium]
YLRQLWKDKAYQGELDDFVKSFKRSGRNIRSIISDADSIVFTEEAYLPGATTVIQAGGRKNALERITSIFTLLKDHALSQNDPGVQEEVAGYIGENLAAAA